MGGEQGPGWGSSSAFPSSPQFPPCSQAPNPSAAQKLRRCPGDPHVGPHHCSSSHHLPILGLWCGSALLLASPRTGASGLQQEVDSLLFFSPSTEGEQRCWKRNQCPGTAAGNYREEVARKGRSAPG
ncbi:UNVERIFIED_CONTAM: hypothetical protein K2H54_037011 [Gekko kuhli]